MNRRQFVVVAGGGALVGGTAYITRRKSSDVEPANEFGYSTIMVDGISVPLAPIDDVIEWHRDKVGVFVDTRGEKGYETARIAGAIHSPAPDGHDENDPVIDYSTDIRIVTYCTCPHHLSSQRGASLIRDGYRNTYAIKEGFNPWHESGYPLAGEDVDTTPKLFRIRGQTDPSHADEMIWAWHDPTGQREAAPIDDDGTFTLNVQFYDVDPDTLLRISSPADELTAPIDSLESGSVEV